MRQTQEIPIRRIDLEDETFSVNFQPDLTKLRSSIERVGLIQPVLLRDRGDRYQIVCGFRRVSVARDLGTSEIEARVVEQEERDEFQLFVFSLHDNLTTRGFNVLETSIALKKLVHGFGVDRARVIREFLPLLSQETNEKVLSTYLSLGEMEKEIKEYVLNEKVSRSNIRMLANFTAEDRGAILSLVSPLKLTESRLKEVLTLLGETAQRDHLTIAKIIGHPEIGAILGRPELTPSQKTERLREVLLKTRYPRMHRLEEDFQRKRRGLNLPPQISLHHSPYFEGKGLRLEFQFGSIEEYRKIVSSLASLEENKELRQMLDREE